MPSTTKYNLEYREQLKRGFNASAIPGVFHPITDEDREEVASRVEAMISDTRKRIGHFTDDED